MRSVYPPLIICLTTNDTNPSTYHRLFSAKAFTNFKCQTSKTFTCPWNVIPTWVQKNFIIKQLHKKFPTAEEEFLDNLVAI